MKSHPSENTSFADTQALWRLLSNDNVSFEALQAPLLEYAKNGIATHCEDYVLAVHDWSRLNYNTHDSKKDRLQMTHATDVGYELQSTVFVSDQNGCPIAAPAQNLVTKDEVLSSYANTLTRQLSHLDELTERMKWIEQQGFDKNIVHIIDREGDSVKHMRSWSEQHMQWLTRSRHNSKVTYQQQNITVANLAEELEYTQHYQIDFKGKKANQWIASCDVILTRDAKPSSKKNKDAAKTIKGEPLPCRLVVTRICDESNKILAVWYLLTNVLSCVPADRISTWYYWRWSIESYFKLLKGAGHELESWQQESGGAILKRLLLASHACALVWQLMLRNDDESNVLKAKIVRLSGRQMKRKKPITASALLTGLYLLFAMSAMLEMYAPEEIKEMAQQSKQMFGHMDFG
jgi:hypothetical protein